MIQDGTNFNLFVSGGNWNNRGRSVVDEPEEGSKMSEAIFVCLECGEEFFSFKEVEEASLNGCPGCGGMDIDIGDGWEAI